jgi:hypothetical protein
VTATEIRELGNLSDEESSARRLLAAIKQRRLGPGDTVHWTQEQAEVKGHYWVWNDGTGGRSRKPRIHNLIAAPLGPNWWRSTWRVQDPLKPGPAPRKPNEHADTIDIKPGRVIKLGDVSLGTYNDSTTYYTT